MALSSWSGFTGTWSGQPWSEKTAAWSAITDQWSTQRDSWVSGGVSISFSTTLGAVSSGTVVSQSTVPLVQSLTLQKSHSVAVSESIAAALSVASSATSTSAISASAAMTFTQTHDVVTNTSYPESVLSALTVTSTAAIGKAIPGAVVFGQTIGAAGSGSLAAYASMDMPTTLTLTELNQRATPVSITISTALTGITNLNHPLAIALASSVELTSSGSFLWGDTTPLDTTVWVGVAAGATEWADTDSQNLPWTDK
jgi:hypothetical protein